MTRFLFPTLLLFAAGSFVRAADPPLPGDLLNIIEQSTEIGKQFQRTRAEKNPLAKKDAEEDLKAAVAKFQEELTNGVGKNGGTDWVGIVGTFPDYFLLTTLRHGVAVRVKIMYDKLSPDMRASVKELKRFAVVKYSFSSGTVKVDAGGGVQISGTGEILTKITIIGFSK